jgi:3-hydroxybutyryl-CoA dehydrogenase
MNTIDRLGVVGAGFMGTGIAEATARAAIPVVVHEPDAAPLERSRERLERSLERAVSAGKLDPEQAAALVGRVLWTTQLDALVGCDLVVEAIVEDVDHKRRVFAQLDAQLDEQALIASNTSSIPVAQLAAATRRRDRVLGLHFFSPVPVMRLVEVVAALDTSAAAIERAEGFAQAIGKHPIRSKDRSGFVVNLLLVPYLMAAVRMYEEGFATPEDIDTGMTLGAGHPVGPLKLCDLIGLDVLHSICDSLHDEFRRPEFAPPPLLRGMVAAGRLGRKSGQGFYVYPSAESRPSSLTRRLGDHG